MEGPFEKSRSQVKREFQELKDLGVRLAGLPRGQLRAVALSDRTRAAVEAANGMARNALQRHYRYLAALLAEEEDVAAIRAALAGELRPHIDDVARLHEVEQQRDQLLSADEDLRTTLIASFPDSDRSELLRLVRNARNERDRNQPPRSARQLFRFLRARAGRSSS